MTLGLLIFISYTIVALNTRAIAKGDYLTTSVSCALFCGVNFALTKFIVEAKTWQEFLWYLAGGVCGDLAGIYISKRFSKSDGM